MKKPTVLIVAPHPDDEVIGAGGFLAKMSREGYFVTVLYVTRGVYPFASTSQPAVERMAAARNAVRHLCGRASFLIEEMREEDQKLGSATVAKIADRITQMIVAQKPWLVLSPYEGDVNRDHRVVSEACRVAAWPQQCSLWEYPVWSSTERSAAGWTPNVFVPLSEEDVQRKRSALWAYENELRQGHARSLPYIEARMELDGAYGLGPTESFVARKHQIGRAHV